MIDKKKTKKPEFWWCIKSGNMLLPFTARIMRRQCVEDWMHLHPGTELGSYNKVVKIKVSEARQ